MKRFGRIQYIDGKRLYLRESRARYDYVCAICASKIERGSTYCRHEPFPKGLSGPRQRAEPVCVRCVYGLPPLPPREVRYGKQLKLSFGAIAIIRPTRVVLVNATDAILAKLRSDATLWNRIGAQAFEDVGCELLRRAGLEVIKVGHAYARDGGLDAVIVSPKGAVVPFIGAVQFKYHRSPGTKTGPSPVRDLAGVLKASPFLSVGFVVTNTSFTADAHWVAKRHQGLIRLRDAADLRRWLEEEAFADSAEWRELPSSFEVCPGVRIEIPIPS